MGQQGERSGGTPVQSRNNGILTSYNGDGQSGVQMIKRTRTHHDSIRILIADDQRLFRQGLVGLFEATLDITVVAEASDGVMATQMAIELMPDVILMDIHMAHLDGLRAMRVILRELPVARIVVLSTSREDTHLFDAIRAGACGYLLKDSDTSELIEAIRRAHAGESVISPAMTRKLMDGFLEADQRALPELDAVLTDREREVLLEIMAGRTNKEIANVLSISEHTVKSHVRNILRKLGVENRAQAAACAIRQGILPAGLFED